MFVSPPFSGAEVASLRVCTSRNAFDGNSRTIKNGFRRLTKDLSYTLGRVLQVAEALQYLHNDAIPGVCVCACVCVRVLCRVCMGLLLTLLLCLAVVASVGPHSRRILASLAPCALVATRQEGRGFEQRAGQRSMDASHTPRRTLNTFYCRIECREGTALLACVCRRIGVGV